MKSRNIALALAIILGPVGLAYISIGETILNFVMWFTCLMIGLIGMQSMNYYMLGVATVGCTFSYVFGIKVAYHLPKDWSK